MWMADNNPQTMTLLSFRSSCCVNSRLRNTHTGKAAADAADLLDGLHCITAELQDGGVPRGPVQIHRALYQLCSRTHGQVKAH